MTTPPTAPPADAPRPGSGMTRRSAVALLGMTFLSGCMSTRAPVAVTPPAPPPPPPVPMMYQAIPCERFPIPAIDTARFDERLWRTEVDYPTAERPGTIVVDTAAKYLYHVGQNGRAMRYGIGVGRDGFSWSGRANVAYKREWPRWTPPDEMVARQPELEPYSIANGGMDPGPENPLGARALYIFQNGVDTIYRIHGTHQEWSIGQAVSSGCIRLVNHDIIHLHANVRDGSELVVIHGGAGDLVAAL